MVTNKKLPFPADRTYRNYDDMEKLIAWLRKDVAQYRVIKGQYKVRDLVKDMEEIESARKDQNWSDGIDAMGEDA